MLWFVFYCLLEFKWQCTRGPGTKHAGTKLWSRFELSASPKHWSHQSSEPPQVEAIVIHSSFFQTKCANRISKGFTNGMVCICLESANGPRNPNRAAAAAEYRKNSESKPPFLFYGDGSDGHNSEGSSKDSAAVCSKDSAATRSDRGRAIVT